MITKKLPKETEPVNVYDYKEGTEAIVNYAKHCDSVVIGRKEPRKYYNIIATFDIETTKTENINWTPNDTEQYHFFNFPFCWQVKVENHFIFGRGISEFFEMLDNASDAINDGFVIIWIHNQAFEYNNLADYFNKEGRAGEHFFKNKSQPLYLRYGNFEFRDTAQLTHKSLAKLGEEIGYKKLLGDFDYSKQRNTKTPLSDLEINYCFRDVEILYRWVSNECDNYCKAIGERRNPAYIPYTQTGYVRHDIKKFFSKTKRGQVLLEQTKLTEGDYRILRTNFWGGFTHTNPYWLGKEAENFAHYDLTSAYPSVIVSRTFPYKLRRLSHAQNFTEEILDKIAADNEYNAFICTVRLHEVVVKPRAIAYIPEAKTSEAEEMTAENGKVLMAKSITLTVNDVQWRIIRQCYEIEKVDVLISYTGAKKRLPHEVVNIVLKYFNSKTTMKGIAALEFEYNLEKQKLNGIFGLMATALINEILKVGQGFATISDGEEYQEASVLPYQWALYTTAYVNEYIVGTINKFENRRDFIYSDTDSIFCIDNENTRQIFAEHNRKNEEVLEHLSLEFFNIMPKNKKGQTQYLGNFEEEQDDGKAFCAIGAKRYYIKKNNGLTELTVSGLRATKIKPRKVGAHTLKKWSTKKPVLTNGYNTDRLIEMYGDIHTAFLAIKNGEAVELPYVEGVDKMSNYNVRYEFEGIIDGEHVHRPCSYTLYPQATSLTLNGELWELLNNDQIMEELEYG